MTACLRCPNPPSPLHRWQALKRRTRFRREGRTRCFPVLPPRQCPPAAAEASPCAAVPPWTVSPRVGNRQWTHSVSPRVGNRVQDDAQRLSALHGPSRSCRGQEVVGLSASRPVPAQDRAGTFTTKRRDQHRLWDSAPTAGSSQRPASTDVPLWSPEEQSSRRPGTSAIPGCTAAGSHH